MRVEQWEMEAIDMSDSRVLLIHGMAPRSPAHWMWPLAEQLRERRIPVQYPGLPDPQHPDLAAWQDLILTELVMLGDGERVVVCHSLGNILWGILGAELPPELRVTRVLMVAPPAPSGLGEAAAAFRIPDAAFGAGAAAGADHVTVVGRATDPFRAAPLAELTAGWRADVVELPGQGHLNPADGHGPWPWVLDWVLGGAGAPEL